MTNEDFLIKLHDLADCYEAEQKQHAKELAEARQDLLTIKAESENEFLSQIAAKDNELIQANEKIERMKKQAQAVVKGNQRMRTLFQWWYESRDRVLRENADLRRQLERVRADRNSIEKERDEIANRAAGVKVQPVAVAGWTPTTEEPALPAGDDDVLVIVRKGTNKPIFLSYCPEVRFLFHQYDQWMQIPK